MTGADDPANSQVDLTVDTDIVTAGADADSTTTSSDSFLEFVSGELTFLRGCSDNQIAKWDETADDWNCENDVSAAGGSAIVLDLGDDGGNDSLDLNEIATTGDTNNIFTESADDKLLIAVGTNWPTADAATALSANGGNCAAGTAPLGVDASGAVESCTDYVLDAGDTMTGQLFINGGADEIQLLVQANAGQTANIFVVEDSAGNDLFDIEANGQVDIMHTATANNEIALDIQVNAAGFGDILAIDIEYESGAIGAGEEEGAIVVTFDESASVAGTLVGIHVLSTAEGGATVYGLEIGAEVNPIIHESGTFSNVEFCEETSDDISFADCVTAFNSTGTNIQIWDADDDRIYIGSAAKFSEVEFIFDTASTNPGIQPTFEFFNGSIFTAFSPIDGTNGARANGVITWEVAGLVGWATTTVDGDSAFWIRITRTANSITAPTESIVQVAATVEFIWDASGGLLINTLSL